MDHLEHFAAHRRHLFALGYKMLGSVMDVEDILQETCVRWLEQSPLSEIRSPKAFLTTILTNLCLNHLHSARFRKEHSLDQALQDAELSYFSDPANTHVLAESLSEALLVLLERLSPQERIVFLLREVFEIDYDDISAIIRSSVSNCRQVLKRARERLATDRTRFHASRQQHQLLLKQFMQTCVSGDLDSLVSLLT